MWRSRDVFLVILFLLFKAETEAQTENPYILNGSAYQENCNCYTLTPDATDRSGSIWNKNKIDLNQSFDFKFNVFLGCRDGEGADGIAFVLQPIGTSIGTTGSGIGFEGVSPSVGVIIDTWQNFENNDLPADHIAIHQNGIISHDVTTDLASAVNALASGGNIEDCKWHTLRIQWDASSYLLTAEVDGVQRVGARVKMVDDIFGGDPMVYWGFTGATGGGTNHQRICTSLNPGFYFPEGQKTCFPEPVTFIDSSHSFGSIQKWIWDFGDNTGSEEPNPPPHVFPAPGIYDVRLSIVGNDGCLSDTFSRKITIGSEPQASFFHNPAEICRGLPVSFYDSSFVAFGTLSAWAWKISGQEYQDRNPPQVILTSEKNPVELKVETLEGCVSDLTTDTVVVSPYSCPELYIPSAFTPNNDGKNDLFRFVAAGFNSITYFRIYNRYGQIVFSSTNTRAAWDGNYKGQQQPSGTYIWTISGTDQNGRVHSKKGTVALIR